MRERDELQNAYNSANSTLQAKAGEIAILRANQIKVDKENEKKLAALQKLNVDEATRHKGEIDEALDQYGKIRIEKSFLEFDQKVTKKVGHVGPLNDSEKESPFTTPKKNKAFPYRDGFNDDEIQTVSPTKLTIRSKPGTPKIGAKRKRKPAEGSPAQPLPLSQAKNDEHQNALNKNLSKDASEVIIKTVDQDDEKFQVHFQFN